MSIRYLCQWKINVTRQMSVDNMSVYYSYMDSNAMYYMVACVIIDK